MSHQQDIVRGGWSAAKSFVAKLLRKFADWLSPIDPPLSARVQAGGGPGEEGK